LGEDLLSAACRPASRLIPCPFSMSFGIGDFEGHGEGVIGGADCEASASRRNADAASRLWLASLGKRFEDEGSALPIEASAACQHATCKCNAPIGRGDFERRCAAVEGLDCRTGDGMLQQSGCNHDGVWINLWRW
jgi:hypothetical protein